MVSGVGRVVKFGHGATKAIVHYGVSLSIFLTSKAAMKVLRASLLFRSSQAGGAYQFLREPLRFGAKVCLMHTHQDFDALELNFICPILIVVPLNFDFEDTL